MFSQFTLCSASVFALVCVFVVFSGPGLGRSRGYFAFDADIEICATTPWGESEDLRFERFEPLKGCVFRERHNKRLERVVNLI